MRLPSSNDTYSMRAIDLNRDRADDLVVATFDPDNNRPYTYFFSFKGNKFKEVAERVPYFASVMRLPPPRKRAARPGSVSLPPASSAKGSTTTASSSRATTRSPPRSYGCT